MRRSREIPACLLLLTASGAITGCQHRDCVDSRGVKQPDSYCSSGVHGGSHYIYGGRSGGRYGDTVRGGRSGGFSDGISRGGFGHGGGGEGE